MRYLTDLINEKGNFPACLKSKNPVVPLGEKSRVHILAMGDVGSTLLLGLKLLGGEVIDVIGIFDLEEKQCQRLEYEMNQMDFPFIYGTTPRVEAIREDQLFDCDLFVFCAARDVPDTDSKVEDVRMAQLAGNRRIVSQYAKMAADYGYKGMFAVVSDPVDPLAAAVCEKGLRPYQVRGFGLGVMNSRAACIAKEDKRFARFLTEGRVFGPHGMDLIVANSIENYDEDLSRELTRLTIKANLKIRATGFKPFLAPAISSGAMQLVLALKGEWHYSSVYLGNGQVGAFMGVKNRVTATGTEIENLPLPDALYSQIETAYINLQQV